MKKDYQNQYVDLLEAEGSYLSLSDIESFCHDAGTLQQYEKKYGPELYVEILLVLTHEKYENGEARSLWENIVAHLHTLTDLLDRNPGIAVAALDYLSNIHHSLSEPLIIEEDKSAFVSETSTRDGLTQLYLRSVFDVTLIKEVEKFIRTNESLSLLMIDIDDFKQINDVYGHTEGDQVLREIGGLINENVRKMDLAARYGGEEIAVILPESTQENAVLLAERIREKISKLEFADFSVTVSIGVSHASKNLNTADLLVKAADEALYEAKRLGKNQVVVCRNYS